MPPSLLSPPPTYVHLLRLYESQIQASYARGEYDPIIFPYHWLPFLTVVLYLLLEPSHSSLLRIYRYASFLFFTWWCIHCMQCVRSPTPHAAYGLGLVNAWSIMWIAALILFNDVKTFRRVWAVRDAPKGERLTARAVKGAANGAAGHSASVLRYENALKLHGRAKGRTNDEAVSWDKLNEGTQLSFDVDEAVVKYYWQSIPSSLWPRFHWLFDLMTSMRGPGWAHQIRSIPTPPEYILSGLPPPHPTARPTVRTFADHHTLIRYNKYVFAVTYLALDILKCVAMRDPYFWGFIDATPLPSHPLYTILNTPLSLRLYRSIFSLAAIGVALRAIFTLNALFFVGLFTSNRWPFCLGIHTDPWAYPNWYGSFSWVATHGIAGWWGAWWHQIFRFGFEAPTVRLCKVLDWDRRSNRGRTLGLTVAFVSSGILHGAGSYTTWPETKPFSGSFLFFASQGIGTLLENIVKKWLERRGVLKRLPVPLKRVLTVAWVLAWMTATAPLLIDDLARSGVWLFEPVPFSFLRFFGYRVEGQGAWAWRGRLLWWHVGTHWWKSGIAF